MRRETNEDTGTHEEHASRNRPTTHPPLGISLHLGITPKFNECQIGQLQVGLSKCCRALPEAWAPALAGNHAVPL